MKKFVTDNIHFVVIDVAAVAIIALISTRNNAAILKDNGLTKSTTSKKEGE